MSVQYDTPQIPEVDGAIRNPADPHHFMVVQPIEHFLQIDIDGACMARTHHALRVIEISGRVLEPRFYIPKADVTANLVETNRKTHCPLKGHASYFSLNGVEVAWCYKSFEFAKILEGHMSFAGENLGVTMGGEQLSVQSRQGGPKT